MLCQQRGAGGVIQQLADPHVRAVLRGLCGLGHKLVMPEDVFQKAQGHREPVGEIRVLIAAGRGDVEGAQRSAVVAVREDVDLIGGVQRRQAGGKVQ